MLLLMVLAACQMAADIAVREEGGLPVVTATDAGGKPQCIQSVAVYPAGVEAAPPVWRVTFGELDGCALRVSYGRTPDGFDRDVAPATLAAGKSYRFAVLGPGINDSVDFTPTVTVKPPAAAPAGSISR